MKTGFILLSSPKFPVHKKFQRNKEDTGGLRQPESFLPSSSPGGIEQMTKQRIHTECRSPQESASNRNHPQICSKHFTLFPETQWSQRKQRNTKEGKDTSDTHTFAPTTTFIQFWKIWKISSHRREVTKTCLGGISLCPPKLPKLLSLLQSRSSQSILRKHLHTEHRQPESSHLHDWVVTKLPKQTQCTSTGT